MVLLTETSTYRIRLPRLEARVKSMFHGQISLKTFDSAPCLFLKIRLKITVLLADKSLFYKLKTLHNKFLCSDSFPVLWASQPYPSSTQGKFIFNNLLELEKNIRSSSTILYC